MQSIEMEIRDIAKKVLEEKKVDLIVGFEVGSLPLTATPVFIRDTGDVGRLVWNSYCTNNLAKYVLDRKEKIGVIAKGCDIRSLVGHIKERQIVRERIFIIGVPCRGMIDRKRIEDDFYGMEILEAKEMDDDILLAGEGFERKVKRQDYLLTNCVFCKHRNPVIYDELIGELVQEDEKVDEFSQVREFEAKGRDERWAYFCEQTSKCIRCYACRNACPLCYCKECFVDSTRPRWIGTTLNPSDVQMYHIIRAFHTAGRCVDCGACVRACPMGVDIRMLTEKLIKDVRDFFDYEAGISIEEPPALASYKEDDPDKFII